MGIEWLQLDNLKNLLLSKKWKILDDADISEILDKISPQSPQPPSLSKTTHENIESVTADVKNLLETEITKINLDKIKHNEDIDYIWFWPLDYMQQSYWKQVRIHENWIWESDLESNDDWNDVYEQRFEAHVWWNIIPDQIFDFVKENKLGWFNKIAIPFFYHEDDQFVYGLAWRNQDVDGREGRCNNLKIRFSEETLIKNKKELNYLLNNPKDFLKLMRDKFPQAVNDDINLLRQLMMI